MSENPTSQPSLNDSPSLTSTLHKTITQIPTSPQKSLQTLLQLQTQISTLHLISRNETLDDVSTPTLPLLTISHHLGIAHTTLPTTSSLQRFENVKRALELHHDYLKRTDDIGGIVTAEAKIDYHKILDNEDSECDSFRMEKREEKIARFRRKQSVKEAVAKLGAVGERRGRLKVDENESMDGWDGEGLRREVRLLDLKVCVEEAIDEIWQGRREVEMLKMAVDMEKKREVGEHYMGTKDKQSSQPHPQSHLHQPPNKPLKLTHITQNTQTGELIIKKEEIKSTIFRPGWNQPTMSLEEYGDRETAAAIERGEQQKIAEKDALLAPRRYDQLVRDGMEDNEELVEASAALDRKWDKFKEENPRGMGNKLKDRGDRNF